MNISSASTQFVQVAVSATIAGASHDPTTDPVMMAFTRNNATPVDSDWNVAQWQEYVVAGVVQTQAMCLVGPDGGVSLPIGSYAVWIKVEDSPEVPVLKAGTLTIT